MVVARIRTMRPAAGLTDEQLLDAKLRRLLDSLDMLEFIAQLEQTFAFKVSDQDVVGRNFESVRSVVEFVRRKLESPAQV